MRRSFRNYSNSLNNKSIHKIRISYIIIIIFSTLIICFSLYLISLNFINKKDISIFSSSSGSKETETTTAGTSETTTETTVTEPPVSMLVNPVPESEAVDPAYFNDCAFVGDSITTGLSGYGFIPEKNVLASTGMNIDKINSATISTLNGDVTILEALKSANPQNIYIMLGSNGIAWLTNEKMIQEYGKFIDEIQAALPDANVYILSIPPVTVNKETSSDGAIENTAIDSYNTELLNMSNNKDLHFVDINTALKGNDGKLPTDWAGKDGMHFKKDTYGIMLDYILKHTAKE